MARTSPRPFPYSSGKDALGYNVTPAQLQEFYGQWTIIYCSRQTKPCDWLLVAKGAALIQRAGHVCSNVTQACIESPHEVLSQTKSWAPNSSVLCEIFIRMLNTVLSVFWRSLNFRPVPSGPDREISAKMPLSGVGNSSSESVSALLEFARSYTDSTDAIISQSQRWRLRRASILVNPYSPTQAGGSTKTIQAGAAATGVRARKQMPPLSCSVPSFRKTNTTPRRGCARARYCPLPSAPVSSVPVPEPHTTGSERRAFPRASANAENPGWLRGCCGFRRRCHFATQDAVRGKGRRVPDSDRHGFSAVAGWGVHRGQDHVGVV
ncbi:hypothetical protein EDB89DRAFT_1909659 [Lactarius sanguifluus]|nr:hypothetical protein EDB89DRAFT_1909659 [Lactarius sanguifluus]